MSIVLDASAAVEFLMRTAKGGRVAEGLVDEEVVAPEILDAEVLAWLRGQVLRGRIIADRARMVVEDLIALPLERISHRPLLRDAYALRDNVSAPDALYCAVAVLLGAPILTLDARLARAPLRGVEFDLIE